MAVVYLSKENINYLFSILEKQIDVYGRYHYKGVEKDIIQSRFLKEESGDMTYCVENYLSDFKICDLTKKQFLFYLNRLKVPNEYIEFSFGNIIELEDYNEERN